MFLRVYDLARGLLNLTVTMLTTRNAAAIRPLPPPRPTPVRSPRRRPRRARRTAERTGWDLPGVALAWLAGLS